MSQQAKKEQVIKLRESGLSFGEISKQLGISRSTVSSICQRVKEQEQHRCKMCGLLLKQTSGHRQRIFCSDKCRKAWWRSMSALISSLKSVINAFSPICGAGNSSCSNQAHFHHLELVGGRVCDLLFVSDFAYPFSNIYKHHLTFSKIYDRIHKT